MRFSFVTPEFPKFVAPLLLLVAVAAVLAVRKYIHRPEKK